jgi:hypothetical protein
LKYDVMFIINQQRRCCVALHFTWFIVYDMASINIG